MSQDELPPGWTSHIAPSGHTYYYNAAVKKSTYKKPESSAPINVPASTEDDDTANSSLHVQAEETAKSTEVSHVQLSGQIIRSDYPKSKVAIAGAEPWLQVRTKKGHKFYHNPETNTSYWLIPQEIQEALARFKSGDHDTILSEIQAQYGQHPDYEYENVSETHSDKGAQATQVPVGETEFDEDDMEWQLAALEEAGEAMYQAHEDGLAQMTYEERVDIFNKMLLDNQVDPFRTWESELEKIASDPRYQILNNTHERKAAFGQYCITQAREIQILKAAVPKEDVSLFEITSLSVLTL